MDIWNNSRFSRFYGVMGVFMVWMGLRLPDVKKSRERGDMGAIWCECKNNLIEI